MISTTVMALAVVSKLLATTSLAMCITTYIIHGTGDICRLTNKLSTNEHAKYQDTLIEQSSESHPGWLFFHY